MNHFRHLSVSHDHVTIASFTLTLTYMSEGIQHSEHDPGSFSKEEMVAFRNRMKHFGGTEMIFGLTEKEATDILEYAKGCGADVQQTDLSESEMRHHGDGDAEKKFAIILGDTGEQAKIAKEKLFGE